MASEIPLNMKTKSISRKFSKKGLKRPPSKLSFSRNNSTTGSATYSSPSQTSIRGEPDSNFNYTSSGRDNDTLANELILLNREVSNLKSQLRKSKKLINYLECTK